MLISIVSFANDGFIPSEKLQKEFSDEFGNATDVKWEKVADYYKASFIQDGQYFAAYFILQKDLKGKVSEASWIADCFELSVENGTEYYVVVESEDQKTIYQANEFSWSVYKKTDK